jgi:hypothetical protein
MRSEGMLKYEQDKGAVEDRFSYVSAILNTAVNGGDPDTVTQPTGCDGGCDSCGGCH